MKTDLFRLTLTAAHDPEGGLSADDQAALCTAIQLQALERLTPTESWALVVDLLMSPYPSQGLVALRAFGGLKRWLPEVDALFGVPHLSDGPSAVDVGLHQLRLVDETAHADMPLAVRFAALMHKIGMAGSPREIWPSHYKHDQRGHALLDALTQRMAVPDRTLALAHLVVEEAERVHRASDVRAGALAAMLLRLDATGQPERFEDLLQVCTCDYAAYEGHTPASYPKAPRLRRALAAYAGANVMGLSDDDALQARAVAIAQALRPQGCEAS
jgi:tRNA nucleotidyltransferase (CCA-adding enzyme)